MAVKHFPIENPAFEMTMNARAHSGPLIEIEPENYAQQVRLRREIVGSDENYYHACPDSSCEIAWEAMTVVLTDLAEHNPGYFSLIIHGSKYRWVNSLLGEEFEISIGDMQTIHPFRSPLDFAGSQMPDDLIIMRSGSDGSPICCGGQLCFAAGWCLGDKMGQSFLVIHEDVPLFADRIGNSSDLLMRRLKSERPVLRFNWTISESTGLNRAPRFKSEYTLLGKQITPENAGEKCYFRVERQTLSRLPKTNGILFTIHTFVNRIGEVADDPERLRLLRGAILSMPRETVEYKNASAYYDALAEYLRKR